MNALTSELLEFGICKYQNPTCLDLGCGDGSACFWLAERGATVLGVDRSLPFPPVISVTIDGASPGEVVLIRADVLEFDPGRRFQIVSALGLLHYLGTSENVAKLLGAIAAWTAPDGRILLSWLLDANPVTQFHQHAHFPTQLDVTDTLSNLGFCPQFQRIAVVEHKHANGPTHRHNVLYSAWGR